VEAVEKKIFILATELDLDFRRRQEFRRLACGIRNWDTLISRSIREGVAGLLYKSLLKSDLLGQLNKPQNEKLRFRYYRSLANNLKYIHEIKRLLPQFERQRARVALLKGIALIDQVYKDIGLRSMSDVDLWVLKTDYDRAVGVLTANRFHPDPYYPNTFRKQNLTIDLHTHFLGADRIRHRTSMLKISSEQIYKQARKIKLDGTEALCLGRYDQIIYLCLHALKHNADQLIWLVDIKFLTRAWRISDWQALDRRADEFGQSKAVAAVLFLLNTLLAYAVPHNPPGLQTQYGLTHLEKKILNLRIKKGALPDWAPLIFFSTPKGFKNSFLLTLETLFPQPEILRQIFQNYPGLKAWQLYIMRFFQLACRGLSLLIKR
jgi:hypothetical protein